MPQLSQLLGIDLVEMEGCNILVHFALRMGDEAYLDVVVQVLQADGAVVKIICDDNKRTRRNFLNLW
jgi:hypothetical protein